MTSDITKQLDSMNPAQRKQAIAELLRYVQTQGMHGVQAGEEVKATADAMTRLAHRASSGTLSAREVKRQASRLMNDCDAELERIAVAEAEQARHRAACEKEEKEGAACACGALLDKDYWCGQCAAFFDHEDAQPWTRGL